VVKLLIAGPSRGWGRRWVSYPGPATFGGGRSRSEIQKYIRVRHFEKKNSTFFSLEGPRKMFGSPREYFPGPAVALDGPVNRKPMTGLRSVTCHIGSHGITCHLTQVNATRLNSIYLPAGTVGWVELVVGYIPRWFTCPNWQSNPRLFYRTSDTVGLPLRSTPP